MFLSIRGRVVVNVEALNMIESVGNYVKRRRVPVIMPETYTVYFVPAISGESIAHGYQQVLAEHAANNNLSVCKLCRDGIFLKSTNNKVLQYALNITTFSDIDDLEAQIVNKCVVEDIGGFMYAEKEKNLKRTSNFYVGYMIPVKEALEGTVIEPQLQTRYALGTPFVKREEERRVLGQMIYYVEISSSSYVFSFDFDSKFVGKATFSAGRVGTPLVNDRKQRVIVALGALKKFLIEFMFGAKKTRYLPVVDWESLVIAVSDDVWTVPSSFTKNYIERAEQKLKAVNYNTKLFVYPRDGGFEEVINRAITEASNRASL
jgi:CRISPR-associated protein Csa2